MARSVRFAKSRVQRALDGTDPTITQWAAGLAPMPNLPTREDYDPFAEAPDRIAPEGAGGHGVLPHFSCPACRGRKRKHTRDHTCRLGPPDGVVPAASRSAALPDVGIPTAWEAACKARYADSSEDAEDPTLLEFIEIEKDTDFSPRP